MEEEKSRVVAETKRVMVAIDESEESFYALEWALKNLGNSVSNSEMVVFTAQPSPDFSYMTGFIDPRVLHKDLEEHHKKTASSILEKAKDICWKFKITPTTVTEVGDAKDAICDAVDNYNIGLLIVGSHGRGAVKRPVSTFGKEELSCYALAILKYRAFLGSVINYCVHNVKCPVLVVRQQA